MSSQTTTENIDAKTTHETTSSDRELVLSRIIDAPRERVFKAWTDPELLKQWFAPLPYTTPVAELDFRPGGANLIVMRDSAGNEFPNRGVYLEVVKNERIVFTNATVLNGIDPATPKTTPPGQRRWLHAWPKTALASSSRRSRRSSRSGCSRQTDS